jgi:hypothetical protein
MRRGFAGSLDMLGSDRPLPATVNGNHAGLIEETIGNPSCTASTWCEKNGYCFRVSAKGRETTCREFAGFAAPFRQLGGTQLLLEF